VNGGAPPQTLAFGGCISHRPPTVCLLIYHGCFGRGHTAVAVCAQSEKYVYTHIYFPLSLSLCTAAHTHKGLHAHGIRKCCNLILFWVSITVCAQRHAYFIVWNILLYSGIVQVNYCLIKHARFVCCVRASVRAYHMKEDFCARASILSLSLRFKNLLQSSDFRDYLHSRLAQPGHLREAFAWQFYAWFDLRRLANKLKKQLWPRHADSMKYMLFLYLLQRR